MLRDVAVTRIGDGLGFRRDLDATIVQRLQEAQRNLEQGKSLPWFLIREDHTINLGAGNPSVALPADFLREVDYETMRWTESLGPRVNFVKRRIFDDALMSYAMAGATGPQVYALRETSLYFLPIPDKNYTLTWSYYHKGVTLEQNVENEWLAHAPELLIGFAGARIARDLRDEQAAELFTAMYNEARTAFVAEMAIRETAREGSAMGGPR
jgi:hypothetical protein